MTNIHLTKIAKTSMGEDYICRMSWPEKCYCQCGHKGIVFQASGDSYTTAFFEAFPEGCGFIRGQGENIIEAEKEAFEKYQKVLHCDHSFKRKSEKGEDGICQKCSFIDKNHFPPLFSCYECGKENVNFEDPILKDKKLCYKHYKEKLYNSIQENNYFLYLEDRSNILSDPDFLFCYNLRNLFILKNRHHFFKHDDLDEDYVLGRKIYNKETDIAYDQLMVSYMREHHRYILDNLDLTRDKKIPGIMVRQLLETMILTFIIQKEDGFKVLSDKIMEKSFIDIVNDYDFPKGCFIWLEDLETKS